MIQASDITIGALLKTNKGEVIRVDSISTKHQHRKVGYHKDWDVAHIHYVRLSQCEGIPLTEEMLLNNGFEKISTHTYLRDERFHWSVQVSLFFDGSVISISNDLQYRGVNNLHVCDKGYVHTLQQALRLCELHDLADNFKV